MSYQVLHMVIAEAPDNPSLIQTNFKVFLLYLGLVSAFFILLSILENLRGYGIHATGVMGDLSLFYYLGKLFSLIAILTIVAIIVLVGKPVRGMSRDQRLQPLVPWFVVLAGLLLGMTFFTPEGLGFLDFGSMYWRFALPFSIVGIGICILLFNQVSPQLREAYLSLLALSSLSAAVLHAILQGPLLMIDLSFCLHTTITGWVLGLTIVDLLKTLSFASLKTNFRSFFPSLLASATVILACPFFIPHEASLMFYYIQFSLVLLTGVITLLTFSLKTTSPKIHQELEVG